MKASKFLIFGLVLLALLFIVSGAGQVGTITLNAPANASSQAADLVLFNITITGQDLTNNSVLTQINVTVNGTTYTVMEDNFTDVCTNFTSVRSDCLFNITLAPYNPLVWNVTTFTNSTNVTINSTNYQFAIDRTSPAVTSFLNLTINRSVATWLVNATSWTPDTCEVEVIEYNGTAWNSETTIAGAYGTRVNNVVACTGTLYEENVTNEGRFIMQFKLNNTVGNTTKFNKSMVKIDIYDGWHLMGWPHNSSKGDATLLEICNAVENCSKASYYNATAGAFTTYSDATPSVNNDTRVPGGRAVLIYTNQNVSAIVNDIYPIEGEENKYATLNWSIWNTIGLITDDSNMSQVLNVTQNSTLTQNLTWASWNSAGTFYTCRKSLMLCSGTSTHPINITMVKGHAVWALTDNTTNVIINKSNIGENR